MSVLNYDGPRRFSRHASARIYPEPCYNERNAPLGYRRADPYAYTMGGPVSGYRAHSHMDQGEYPVEHQGQARRRIAVAVSIPCATMTGSQRSTHRYYYYSYGKRYKLTTHLVRALSEKEDTLQRRHG